MTPAFSNCETRRRQADGDSPTRAARSTFEMRALFADLLKLNDQYYPLYAPSYFKMIYLIVPNFKFE